MDFADHSSLNNEIETPEKNRDRPKVPKVPGFYQMEIALCDMRPCSRTVQLLRLESLIVYI